MCSGLPEVRYLSCVISAEGILPNPDKILAVKEFPTHTNVRAVREYLGLASYYRQFVPDFAKGPVPLHMLTRASVQFLWLKDSFHPRECTPCWPRVNGEMACIRMFMHTVDAV